jgi:hypothetical protein
MEKNNQLSNYHIINKIEKIEVSLMYILIFIICLTFILLLNFVFSNYVNIFYYLAAYFILSFSTIYYLFEINKYKKYFE